MILQPTVHRTARLDLTLELIEGFGPWLRTADPQAIGMDQVYPVFVLPIGFFTSFAVSFLN